MPARPDPSEQIPVDATGLRARALGGAGANLMAQGMKLAVQFASVIVLARLLSPADFGVFGMVMPIMAFVMIFQDLGLSQAVVTSPSLTYGQLSSLFWINLTLAILIGAIFAALASVLAQFYQDQRIFHLTLALAGTAPISGLMTQHFALLGRQMRFTWLAILDVISLICGFLAAVAVAWFSPNYWALFVSFVVTLLVLLAGAWFSAGWWPGRPAPWNQVSPMLHFGGGVIGYNLSTYVARNLDKVLIGWRAGPLQLGLYDRAYKLLLLPLQNLNSPIARVMVPILSRLANDPVRYRRVYVRMAQQIILIGLPGVVFMIITAPLLIPTLLGKQWAGAVPVFTWLSLAGLHLPMSGTMAWLFLTQSRTSEYARWGLFNAVTCAAAFAIGLPWGAYGVAVAFGLSDILVRQPVLWWYVGRRGPVRTRDLYGLATPFVPACGAAAFIIWNINQTVPYYFLLTLAASYITTGVVLATFAEGRRILHESYDLALGYVTEFRRARLSSH